MADEPDDDYESGSDIDSVDSGNIEKKVPKKVKIINKDEDYDGVEEEDEEDDEDYENEDEDEYYGVGDEDEKESDEKTEIRISQHFPDLDEDDDEDEDEDDDENYLQKFGEDIQKTIIQDYHPELQAHNNDEIETLSIVTRDANGIIIDPLHKTMPIVSRYEKARVLGERAKQLNAGAEPFVEIDETMIDGYMIALKEFEEKKIPFIIQRPLPNGACEYWKLRDLEIL
jgi:DNA-directed RNA polymerase subunit K/omega